jgi:hypothetical protein
MSRLYEGYAQAECLVTQIDYPLPFLRILRPASHLQAWLHGGGMEGARCISHVGRVTYYG